MKELSFQFSLAVKGWLGFNFPLVFSADSNFSKVAFLFREGYEYGKDPRHKSRGIIFSSTKVSR